MRAALTVGELQALLAALPPEAAAWPLSANHEYAITGIEPYSPCRGEAPVALDLTCA